MKIKLLLFAIISVLGAFGACGVNLEFLKTNANMVDYDYTDGVYTFTTTGGDPYVFTSSLAETLPASVTKLTFEYQAEQGVNNVQIFFVPPLSEAYSVTGITIPASKEWTTFSYSIRNARSSFGWGSKGNYLRFDFGVTQGVTIKIKNLKLEGASSPYKEVTLMPKGSTTVQAEDYDKGGAEDGYSAHQYGNLDLQKYVNPAGEEFPIMAWLNITGSDQEFRDMYDSGVNLNYTQGHGSHDNIDNMLGNASGSHVRQIPNFWRVTGSTNEDILKETMNRYKDNDGIAGWALNDEPYGSQFEHLGQIASWIRKYSPNKLVYLNLLHSVENPINYTAVMGSKNYADYLQQAVRKIGVGMISMDCYPIVRDTQADTKSIRSFFFESLEITARVARQYGIPFWGFARSKGDSISPTQEFPTPTEPDLRLQVFANLAYGAQGIQYYTYSNTDTRYTRYNAPLEIDPNAGWTWRKTETYYMLQRINKEIQNHRWVFLNDSIIDVSFTGKLPKATKRLKKTDYPDKVKSMTNKVNGAGFLVSQFKNGNNRFFMVLNRELESTQTLDIEVTDGVNVVNADGTTSALEAGAHQYELTTGDYLLLQWSEAAEVDKVKIAAADDADTDAQAYRSDNGGVEIMASADFENGYGLKGMGDDWRYYSLGDFRTDNGFSITAAQAQQNWGCWFAYTVEAPEDMDVDISFKSNMPWDEYGRATSVGCTPGQTYSIYQKTNLNWPKRYAGAMVVSLDGETLKPNQTMRPVAPDVFEADGATFNETLADKSKWISTKVGDAVNDTVWMWPAAGGVNTLASAYSDVPQYANVHLTKGKHTFRVTSLSSPWNFDCFKLTDVSGGSGVVTVEKNAAAFKAFGVKGAIVVSAEKPVAVYTTGGALVGRTTSRIEVPAGVYVVTSGTRSVKVIVK